MKQYFAKYLPVEGEIKEGDFFQFNNEGFIFKHIGVCTETGKIKGDNPEGYDGIFVPNWNLKKMKLFLCSKNIQFGNGIYYKNSPVEYQCSSRHTKNKTINVCPIKDPDGIVKGSLSEQDCFQVVGEISPEATWVKEKDEFDETEWRRKWWMVDGSFFTRHEWHPSDEHTDLGEGEKQGLYRVYLQIKGPCGHFH